MRITEGNYVDEAEKVIKKLSSQINKKTQKKEPMVTTSKIRNLLAMTTDIYNEVRMKHEDNLDEDLCGRIQYLRIRFVYEAGRDNAVKKFVEESHILNILQEIKGSRKNYLLFNRYMESLIAFHKFYDGKD